MLAGPPQRSRAPDSARSTALFVSAAHTPQESILSAVEIKEEERAKPKSEDAALDILVDGKKHLLVCITTDRGLCGAVNSSLSRNVRKEVNAAAKAGAHVKLFVLGDKGRAQIARDYLPLMTKTIDNYLDQGVTFALAASIAAKVCAQEYEVLTLVYNHYENQVRYNAVYKKVPQFLGLPVGVLPAQLKGFEIEPENNEETLVNMQEYAVASAILFAMLETQACETSQRVTGKRLKLLFFWDRGKGGMIETDQRVAGEGTGGRDESSRLLCMSDHRT